MATSSQPHRRHMMGLAAATVTGAALPFAAKADDAPAAPKTPIPEIEAFAGSPLVDQIAISPDGSRVALITQNGDEKILMVLLASGGGVRRTHLGPAKIRNLLWGDNSHVVIISSETARLPGFAGNRHEFLQARSVDVETGDLRTFFSDDRNFYPIVMGNVQRIKTADGYRVTASNYNLVENDDLCLYSFALDTIIGHKIDEGSTKTREWVVREDGFPLAYNDFDDVLKIWTLYFNSGSPKAFNFKPVYKIKNAVAYPSVEGIGRDGNSILLYLPTDPERSGSGGDYVEISSDGQLSPPVDIRRDDRERTPLFHPQTRRLVGFARHGDWFTYDYFDPVMKKLAEAVTVVMGEDYRSSLAGFAEDPRLMIIYGEGPADAGSYYYSDFATGDLQLLASNYNLPAEWLSQKQPFDYVAADGLNIHAYLTLPPFRPAANLPLIVLPHGGPQSRDYLGFDWQAQVLAARGYAVLQPNFRGSEGYGDAFVRAGHGEWGRKMQTDLSDGVRFLAAKGTINPKRVAILGASYGGYAALAGATLDAGVYVCAVSIAGISDVNYMIDLALTNSGDVTRAERVLNLKRMLGDPDGYNAISPAKQAAKAYCPVLLIHGTDDTVVPIDQSRRMEKAMKAAGKPVEFVTYKGQDHWETVGSSRVAMMKAALDFLMRHNPA